MEAVDDGTVAVGLESGDIVLLGRGLQPVGRVKACDSHVQHIAVLRRAQGGPILVVSDTNGNAAEITLQ